MIKGAMDVQVIADPADAATDIGPIIDAEARGLPGDRSEPMKSSAKIWQREIGALRDKGTFFGPRDCRAVVSSIRAGSRRRSDPCCT